MVTHKQTKENHKKIEKWVGTEAKRHDPMTLKDGKLLKSWEWRRLTSCTLDSSNT